MLGILGKSASGKDTVCNILISDFGYEKVLQYTTRPMRQGEINGVTYYFIHENEFLQRIEDGFFVEWKKYNTVDGDWYYGHSVDDCNNAKENSIIVLPPDRYGIVSAKGYELRSIYLYANISTIKERLKERGDKKEEIERRIKTDNEEFKGIEKNVDKIIYNNEGTKIEEVIKKILLYEKRGLVD